MRRVVKSDELIPNATDLGIEVRAGDAYVPSVFGRVLESLGARTVPAAISALEDFPTPFLKVSNLPRDAFFEARERALTKLRDASEEEDVGYPLENVGFGALPPVLTSKK